MFAKRLLSFFLCLVIIGTNFLPVFAPRANAFALSSALSAIGLAKLTPQVPVGDTVNDVVMSILNGVAITVAQGMVNEIVNSTIRWANTGFEGNPAFVTDPRGYLGNIANGIAGNFIQNSSVGFLCSPLQNVSLKISLAKYYTQPYQPQCTLTQIKGNIDDFYNSFDNGGWGAFIQLTQESQNNPYGSFVDAQVELDNQLASALSVQKEKLDWNQGFRSKGDCVAYNASAQQINDYENGVSGPGTIASGDVKYNDTLPAGACIEYGPDKTPGSVIKDELTRVVGSGYTQLMDVKKFDELVDAVASGLLQRYVFGSKGLFSKDYASGLPSASDAQGSEPAKPLSCAPSTTQATAGDTLVTWSASLVGGGADVEYIWTGDEFANSSNATSTDELPIIYHDKGPKKMSVTANVYTDTQTAELSDPTNPNSAPTGNTITTRTFKKSYTASCDGAVQVSQYQPLAVECSANTAQAGFNQPVTWTATITGGSGKLARVEWHGDQDVVPKQSGDAYKIWPDSLISDSNDTYNPPIASWDWKPNVTLNIQHTYSLGGPGSGGSTETILRTVGDNGVNKIVVSITRSYYQDKDSIISVDPFITVVDQDTELQSVINHQCSGSITISQK